MVHIRGTPENMHSLSVEYFAPTFSFNQFPTIIEWLQKEPILSLLHCTAIQFYIADISYCRYCIESIKFQQVPAIGFEAASICPWVFALLNGECFFSQGGVRVDEVGRCRKQSWKQKGDWWGAESWHLILNPKLELNNQDQNNFWEGSRLEKCKRTFGPSRLPACIAHVLTFHCGHLLSPILCQHKRVNCMELGHVKKVKFFPSSMKFWSIVSCAGWKELPTTDRKPFSANWSVSMQSRLQANFYWENCLGVDIRHPDFEH